jgi:hypothetical protein
MMSIFRFLLAVALPGLTAIAAVAQLPGAAYNTPDVKLTAAEVVYNDRLDALVWQITVAGQAGRTLPKPVGSMDGAPVLAYVFPTTLKSTDVGFSATDGIVALGLTAHPDMDDTPLWDENNDGIFDNDGLTWHPHWVVLTKDDRVPGGLSVKAFQAGDKSVTLPKTAPGLPLYFDSPGFNVVTRGNAIRVIVPAFRVNNRRDFNFDAVSCYMQMSMQNHGASHDHAAAGPGKPTLGVYAVYGVLSGKLSLPYAVTTESSRK